MNLESRIERLEEKLDKNANKIMENMNKLHSHEEQINNNSSKIQQNSFAIEFLSDYKKSNKRQFIIILIILIMWFLTIGYLVYILNDIGTIDETTTQEIDEVSTINGNIINKGNSYGESKTNNQN